MVLAAKESHPTDDPNFPSYQCPEYVEIAPYLDFISYMEIGPDLWLDLYGNIKNEDIAKKMIKPFSDEEPDIWRERVEQTTWVPIFQPQLEKIPGFINDIQPKETVFQRFRQDMSDADLNTNSLRKLMSLADYLMLRDQLCFGLVDFYNPGKKSFTSAEVLTTDVRPFIKIIDRRNVPNWSFKRNKFESITIRYLENGNYVYHEHYADGRWEIKEIHSDEQNGFYVVIREEGKNTLGFIPVILYSLESINPFKALPPLRQIAKLQKAHYNYESEDRHAMIRQGFNTLVVSSDKTLPRNLADITDPRNDENVRRIKRGVTKGIQIDGEGAKAYYIHPDPSWALIYSERKKEIIEYVKGLVDGFIGSDQKNRIYKSRMELGIERSQQQAPIVTLVEEKLGFLDQLEKIWCKYYNVEQKYGDDEFNNFEIGFINDDENQNQNTQPTSPSDRTVPTDQ
jgi:hypothetical protein